jgi:hypothetical protein
MKLESFPTRIHPSGQPHDLALSADSASFDFHTVTWQADGFGFDATSGEFFTASPTALIVMKALSEDVARLQILDRLTARFEVTQSTAERDLESFLAELVRIGLVRESN